MQEKVCLFVVLNISSILFKFVYSWFLFDNVFLKLVIYQDLPHSNKKKLDNFGTSRFHLKPAVHVERDLDLSQVNIVHVERDLDLSQVNIVMILTTIYFFKRQV